MASQNAIKLEQLEIDTCLLTHASGTNIWQVKIIPGECTVTVTSPYDECCQNLVFNTELRIRICNVFLEELVSSHFLSLVVHAQLGVLKI